MNYVIMTDLEGVSGVDSFRQTRTTDNAEKGGAMKQLARETNACLAGIRDADPTARVTVIDGHGTGGLFPDDLDACDYTRYRDFKHEEIPASAALFFVGQHAMAGTIDAPLCHTMSSLHVQYYRVNGVYVGEFGVYANWFGLHGVPTVFLAGDDKAALEAQMFVPQIETVVTKYGKGIEAAEHRPADEVCRSIREGAARAVRRLADIPPFAKFRAPFVFEARHYEPLNRERLLLKPEVRIVDDRTYRIETDNYRDFPFF